MTTTGTMTLADFLLARIAEDGAIEAVYEGDDGSRTVVLANRQIHEQSCSVTWVSGGGNCNCDGDKRWLAECEAKRRIVALHKAWTSPPRDPMCEVCGDGQDGYWGALWPCETLQLLATPYADHPDYRAEWRV